jgi:hypothetical protein
MAARMAQAACTGIPEMTLTVALINTRFACPERQSTTRDTFEVPLQR